MWSIVQKREHFPQIPDHSIYNEANPALLKNLKLKVAKTKQEYSQTPSSQPSAVVIGVVLSVIIIIIIVVVVVDSSSNKTNHSDLFQKYDYNLKVCRVFSMNVSKLKR